MVLQGDFREGPVRHTPRQRGTAALPWLPAVDMVLGVEAFVGLGPSNSGIVAIETEPKL